MAALDTKCVLNWMDVLPATCKGEILDFLSAMDLASASVAVNGLGEIVNELAWARVQIVAFEQKQFSEKRRARRPWLRALRYYERLVEHIGAAPTDRSWRDEWLLLEKEREIVLHSASTPEDSLRYVLPSAEWKYGVEWPRDLAQGHTLIMTKFKSILGDSIRSKTSRFAASCHTICSALTCRAAVEPIAPPAYNDLDGPYGLRRADRAWATLPNAPIGYEFETTTPIEASAFRACLTPLGFCAPIIDVKGDSDDVQYQPQDSDVVCFISKPSDGRGFHSLVRTACTKFESQYDLPPFAKIILVKVQEPLTWMTGFQDGQPQFPVKRRLYTVEVTFL